MTTIIKITTVPDEDSDDLEWEVLRTDSGFSYELVDDQPEGVTPDEDAERILVRDGVEWRILDENFGQPEGTWWRESDPVVNTDSWNNSLVDALWREYGQYTDEDVAYCPALRVGTVLEVEDDYWGDGIWDVVSIEEVETLEDTD